LGRDRALDRVRHAVGAGRRFKRDRHLGVGPHAPRLDDALLSIGTDQRDRQALGVG